VPGYGVRDSVDIGQDLVRELNIYQCSFQACSSLHLRRVAWIGSNVRASNEALLRARVPRAQEPTRPPSFFLLCTPLRGLNQQAPHIHVEQAERYAKFWLDPVSIARTKGFRSSEVTDILHIVQNNHQLFQERWHEFFGHKI
jgi:hypothetical protein